MSWQKRPVKDRLLDLIEIDRCWVWKGSLSRAGYGRLTIREGGKKMTKSAHRVSYETFVGKIPVGLTIDHLCKNKACINPDHLEAVSQKVNVHRANPLWKQEAARTHCPQGHEYTEDNMYKYKTRSGGVCRNCKTCMKARTRARYQMKKLTLQKGIV